MKMFICDIHFYSNILVLYVKTDIMDVGKCTVLIKIS